jgi:hypothetical protein
MPSPYRDQLEAAYEKIDRLEARISELEQFEKDLEDANKEICDLILKNSRLDKKNNHFISGCLVVTKIFVTALWIGAIAVLSVFFVHQCI